MHGLQTLVYLNQNNQAKHDQNARDPGNALGRRSHEALQEAVSRIDAAFRETVTGKQVQKTVPFPPDFSIIRHTDEYWVLPLTVKGRTIAGKMIPENTRRYGLHYILEGDLGKAIVDSIQAAGE